MLASETDSQWELLLALRRSAHCDAEVVAGFATVYRFFAFPSREAPQPPPDCRLRLSQLLTCQPHQRRGVASLLLLACRQLAVQRNATDLTVEDASDDLQRLRERLDLKAALATPAAAQSALAVSAAQAAGSDAERIAALEAPFPAVAEALRRAMRLCRLQARIVWEALLFVAAHKAGLGAGSPAAAAFREMLARRVGGAEAVGKGAADAPRKFVLDVEDVQAAPKEEEGALAALTPHFLMAKGVCDGAGRARPVAAVQAPPGTDPQAALAELLGIELARLSKLAEAVLSA